MTRYRVSDFVKRDSKHPVAIVFPDGVQRIVAMRVSQYRALLDVIENFLPLSRILESAIDTSEPEFSLEGGPEVAIREGTLQMIEVCMAGLRSERGDHANDNDPRDRPANEWARRR